MTIKYVMDYYGDKPEGDLIDASGDMVDELDAAHPEQFETLEDALQRLSAED